MSDNKDKVPPHLVVRFKLDANNDEQFEWGVTGGIPMMGLLGALCNAQVALSMGMHRQEGLKWHPGTFLLVWDADTRRFGLECDPDIPIEPIVGMIEVVKDTVKANIARSAQAQLAMQRVLVGIDGRPIRG